MKLKIKKIGDLINLDEKRNIDGKLNEVLGVNISKTFMPTIANLSETDLTKYKILNKHNFACNIMHVGRDERLPIALFNKDKPALVSPAYKVFSVKDTLEILPEFLMIYFQRSEFDRRTWYFCDSSVRGGLEWDRFEDITITFPVSINDQQKFVNIYKNLLRNKICYEKSFKDLEYICSRYIDDLKQNSKTFKLGDYIDPVTEFNYDLKNTNVRGISSVEKKFMKAKANMTGVNLSDYKIVKNNHFAYNPNTARMGERIPLALNKGDTCLVSKIYPVFKIKNENLILPDYLYIFFKRKEFDRYARYHSWGSARETFDWDDMCNVEIPIPDIEMQKSLVLIGSVLDKRKKINNELEEIIKNVCPVLFKSISDNFYKTIN